MASNKTKAGAKATDAVPDAAADELPRYTAQSRLLHDGQAYEPGEPVALTDADAAPLLAAGAIAPLADEPAADA